jgi:hypothetical protein
MSKTNIETLTAGEKSQARLAHNSVYDRIEWWLIKNPSIDTRKHELSCDGRCEAYSNYMEKVNGDL